MKRRKFNRWIELHVITSIHTIVDWGKSASFIPWFDLSHLSQNLSHHISVLLVNLLLLLLPELPLLFCYPSVLILNLLL